jgi:hypothetical protein
METESIKKINSVFSDSNFSYICTLKFSSLRKAAQSRALSVGLQRLSYGLEDWRIEIRLQARAKESFSSPQRTNGLWGPPSLIPPRGYRGRGMYELTTRLRIVPRFSTRETTVSPPLHHTPWRGVYWSVGANFTFYMDKTTTTTTHQTYRRTVAL